jgi:hypothetical protein
MKGMISAICVVLCVTATAFGASGNNLGGSFYPEGYDGPRWSSYSYEVNVSGVQEAQGSFNIQLDANTASFETANWNFWTNGADTSYWNATCYLHGRRDMGEEYPQNQYWSQSINLEDLRMDANLTFQCYDQYSNDISNLQAQIASLQAYLAANPGGENVQEVASQIQSLQTMLGQLETKDKQVLEIYGSFDISPSDLLSSNFSYREEMQSWYTYPNGYDNPPVITQVPVWNGQYDLHGRFIASTIEEARGLGAQFAKDVPEPSTIVLMLGSLVAGFAAYLRRR